MDFPLELLQRIYALCCAVVETDYRIDPEIRDAARELAAEIEDFYRDQR